MTESIETDYLVIGAGAAGMSIVNELLAHGDGELVLIDRRHRAGGHWLDAYPFVRLHQPSHYYGVNSRPLGNDRIDSSGPNAGFYERASVDEICDYYGRVLDEQFLASGRVAFHGMHDYRGRDGDDHVAVSRLTGRPLRVRVRRRFIDATFVETVIPSRHTPSYSVAPDARLITPNQLVDYGDGSGRFTVFGAGKTAMDTCVWLLDQGVDPDRIRWVRPRDGWFVDRAGTQPLELVAQMMAHQAATFEAAAQAESGLDFALRLEERGMMMRLDRSIEPEIFRGATLSRLEFEALQTIEQVIRLGRVESIGSDRIDLSDGRLATGPDVIHIDCTAPGLTPSRGVPIFGPDGIRVQPTTLGVSPLSAALIGFVESLDLSDEERNRLCPLFPRSGLIVDQLEQLRIGYSVDPLRKANSDIAAWTASARLNPGRSVADRTDDPQVAAALATIAENVEVALANLNARSGRR